MQIIIMRHGQADFCGSDRVLTSEGQREVLCTGRKLAAAYHINKIFSSPKTRTMQTAQMVYSCLKGHLPPIEILNDLRPSGSADLVWDYIQAVCAPEDTVLLVTHIPMVAYLPQVIVPDTVPPVFHTACALVISCEPRAHFACMLEPAIEYQY